MKDLNIYVEELLYKHPCVIIPKFGAFISNRKSAKLFEDKTFSPPKRELTFNASLNSNDGLLLKHISETSGVDYKLVEEYVNSTVESWKKALTRGENLSLKNIGLFRQTPEGKVSFEAFEDVNYLTDSFGMSPFVPHEINEMSNKKIAENQVSPTIDPVVPKPSIEPTVPENRDEAEDSEQQPVKKGKKRSFVKYTAVAVVGLILLTVGVITFFGEPLENNEEMMLAENQIEEKVQQKLSEATLNIPMSFSAIPVEVTKVDALKPKDNDVSQSSASQNVATSKPTNQNKTEVKTNKKETTPVATTAPKETTKKTNANSSAKVKKYQVIAGAFKEEKNANTKVAQLKKLGFKNAAVIGINAKGLYQVSYAGFDSMAEAEALKQQIKAEKDTKKLEGGWILTNE